MLDVRNIQVGLFLCQPLAWEERLAAAGIPIDDRTPKTLFLRDPEGHRVALSTYRFPSVTGQAP